MTPCSGFVFPRGNRIAFFCPCFRPFPAPRRSKYPKVRASVASNDSSRREQLPALLSITMSWGLNMTLALCQQIDVPLPSVLDARRPPIPELSPLRMPALSVCMCGAESGATLLGDASPSLAFLSFCTQIFASVLKPAHVLFRFQRCPLHPSSASNTSLRSNETGQKHPQSVVSFSSFLAGFHGLPVGSQRIEQESSVSLHFYGFEAR